MTTSRVVYDDDQRLIRALALDHVAFISDLGQLLPTIAAMPPGATPEKTLDRM
jgi:hypothetical protein